MKTLNYRVLIGITPFSEQNGKTTVRITIYNESLARMEKMIEMGFKEGFTIEHDQPGKSDWQLYPKNDRITKYSQILLQRIGIRMNVQEQIKEYITSQPEPKRSDMQELHRIILQVMPACKLWFLDGKNSENKTVSNPNIGYGSHTIKYADGKTREFYQIGMSANKTGISVYILGIKDKTYLAQTYGKKLGKASVSGYCIKFKTLKDINIDILEAAIRYGVEVTRIEDQYLYDTTEDKNKTIEPRP